MKHLTQKLVDPVALPRQGQEMIRDTEPKGFGLQLTPGGMFYVVEARVNGTCKRLKAGRVDVISVQDSRAEAKKKLARMADGIHPHTEMRKQIASAVAFGLPLLD